MGKKRKAGGRAAAAEPRSPKEEDSKMRVTTYADVADSEDEFHMNRDRVLLEEGPAAKRLRKWKEQDEFLEASDEEVLGYNTDTDEEEEEEYEEEDGEQSGSEDEFGARGKGGEDEEEEMEGWGPSKKDYYDADAIQTEQDALDEEAEARRIQKKQLEAMTEADFGFDENDWMESKDEKSGTAKVVTEILPQLQITDDMSEKEKLRILHARYPEFEPIRQDFVRLQGVHAELRQAAEAAERALSKSGKASALRPKPTAVLKYWACASYLGAMCMYFAVLTSTAKDDGSAGLPMDPEELHRHPVMESLLKCQKVWKRLEDVPVEDLVEGEENISEEEAPVVPKQPTTTEPDAQAKLQEAIARKRAEKKAKKKSKAQLAAEAAKSEAGARRAEKLRKTEQELANLATLTDKSALRKAAKQKKTSEQPLLNLLNADDSDFGEETSLTAHELAEKARKKKSLRFYTSQITQKASKRGAAGRDQGGDADIPHRERLKDRQARLQAEAEKRGQSKDKGPGVALGEGDDSDDGADRQENAASDDDGYYDMVAARNKAKKQEKAERAAAYAKAAKENATVIPEEVIGEDGKRKITYLIAKNKGLTPHRKKEVRNPRVKKKLKFEKKKKALKSMKAVYGGGEGKGGYQGELTGIKTGLVRSTKL
ncbi:hypothetical protein M011DRAFT_425322 [Sporormia fimetaria CBS 119925]|uniref:Sas10 C-terminal domain-containing protein n=1 Tax=Sporormia fimetaria CBS 119925 TaxID=1340428 RepID=A0A6A6VAI8_9PLEO|nr:hypothetical protein M011DRAFT_425322 [Sporormia fimetaria CBS 119925]